jgi:tetratricopeptide (TPR) repeat protein/ADP-heptose:LPS heptosyltransferase
MNLPRQTLATNPPVARQRARLQQAVALHRDGRLAQAQTLYQEILNLEPRHVDALHLLGVIAAQTKNPQKAVELIGKAIEIDPTNAAAYSNRGAALKEIKQFDAALASYNQAIAIKSDYAEAYSNRGNVLKYLKQFHAALASYNQAIAINAGNAEVYFNRGVVLQELGQLNAALASYDQAIAHNTEFAEAHFYRGVALRNLKQYQAAIASFDKAIALKPDCPEAYFDRALTLSQLEQNRAALAGYDQAIASKPDFAEAHCNRGNVLMELEQFEAALDSYNQAIAIRAGYAMAYSNRGSVLKKLGRLEASLASYNQAIAINGDYAEAHFNRGVVLNELNCWDAALASYDRAIAIQADYAEAYCQKSYVQLLMGDLKEGWLNSEWRWKSKYASDIHEKRYFSQPLWLGNQPISGRTILLHSEQGLGDTIQFCRYAKLVADLGAKVILEVQEPLVTLLTDLEGVSRLISRRTEAVDFDYQCPLLSLPLAFQTELDTIPAPVRYLRSDAVKVARWRVKLGKQNAPRIGLAWRGNPKNTNDHNRSIALANLIHYLPCDFQYVSLQKEVLSGEEKALHAAANILHFADDQHDFSDAAALCECMDAVVSVDTSLAHLGAALGKPTWILLPFSADWRWLAERADSPWYPTATLYRQKNARDWKGVLEQLQTDLLKEFKAIQAQ